MFATQVKCISKQAGRVIRWIDRKQVNFGGVCKAEKDTGRHGKDIRGKWIVYIPTLGPQCPLPFTFILLWVLS